MNNYSGRIIGGTLIGIALLWMLSVFGALPFRNRTTNQIATAQPSDQPAVTDPNATRPGASNQNTNPPSPPTGTQNFNPDNQTGSNNTNNQSPNSSSDSGFDNSDSGLSNGVTTRPAQPTNPVVRAGW